jgi:hypothetical protein
MRTLPVPVIVLAGLFGVAMIWLVGASLSTRAVPTYAPRSRSPGTHAPAAPDTVTIDARDPDRWQFFAFAAGALMPPDTAGWDIAVRRFHIMVAGEAVGIDSIAFEALQAPPSAGYQATRFDRDTVNRAIARWYRYSMFSHLLRPRRQIYAIRSRLGVITKLEFLSYYCPGPEPGCVTFRYASISSS